MAFEDPRVKYVEIQIDRSTWDEIKAWKGNEAPVTDDVTWPSADVQSGHGT